MTSHVRVAGRYQLDEVIAVGGFGEVWRATDTLLARPVAVKLLLADHVQHPGVLARFRTEAQRAGSLSHENIARVYDYLEPDPPDPPFLVMELVDGPSVAQLMSDGPVGAAWAMHIVAGAAAGLEAAHQAGVVHRDIKPANLLLTRNRRVKVTDFGISHAVNSAPITSTGQIMGTSGYLAPERLDGTGLTTATDLYALGVVGYECLTGAPPFTGMPIEVAVAHRDQPLPPLPASVPPGVAALIMDLTAKDPAARPASAAEVAARAAQLRDSLTASGTGVPGVFGDAPAKAGTMALQAGYGAPPADAEQPSQDGWPGHDGSPGTGPEQGGFAPPGPGPRARRGRGTRWAAAAGGMAIVLAVTGLVIARTAGSGSPGHGAAAPSSRATPGVATVQTIEVNAASLLGRPVDSAGRQLRQLGLPVRVIWEPSRRQSPGTVLAVQPSGQVAPHTVITLIAAEQPAGQSGVVTVGHPSAGPGTGGSPTGRPTAGSGPAPGNSPASSPSAGGTGSGSTPAPTPTPTSTPAPTVSPTPSTGTGNGNGQGNGNGNSDGGGNGQGQG